MDDHRADGVRTPPGVHSSSLPLALASVRDCGDLWPVFGVLVPCPAGQVPPGL